MKLLKMLGEKHRQNAHRTIANYFAVVLLVIGFGFSAQSWAYDCSPPNQTDIPQEECEALLILMEATIPMTTPMEGDDIETSFGATPFFWGTSRPICSDPQLGTTGWLGIDCKTVEGSKHITEIAVWRINGGWLKLTPKKVLPDFRKTTSPYSMLPYLESLNLSNGDFKGTNIPNFSLPKLKRLNLASSNLGGTIPDFTNMPTLNYINLGSNSLTGNIPNFSGITDPALIWWFSVPNNKLTGSVPIILANVAGLHVGYNCSEALGNPRPSGECNVTIKGFVFHDKDVNGKYSFENDQKIAFYNQLVIDNGNVSKLIQVNQYGDFSVDIEESGNLQITNYNSLGWKQTTPLNTTSGIPTTGAYKLELANNPAVDYSNVAIGVAVGTAEPPVSGIEIQHAPVTLGCKTQMYTFTCAPTTGETVKSCQIYFDEGAPITLNAPYLSVDHLFKEIKSYRVSATGVLTNGTRVKAEDVTISIGQDAFSCFCNPANATHVSTNGSIVNNSSGNSQIVYINHSVSFNALSDAGVPKNHAICIDSNGELKNSGDTKLNVGELTIGGSPIISNNNSPSFIYNKGKIFIENNNSFVKPRDIAPSTSPTAGYDLTLYAKDFIVNEGKIQAGSGGNIVDHTNGITQTGLTANTEFAIKNEFLKPYPALDLNPIVAQKGGNVTLGAPLVSNYGTIGPDTSIDFTPIKGGKNDSTGELFTSGGNGGVASRSSVVQRFQTQSSNNDCSNLLVDKLFYTPKDISGNTMIGYTLGNAVGGDGGDVNITQFNTFENFGVIKAGEGGAARVWECNSTYADNIAIGGKGGKVTVSPNPTVDPVVKVRGYGVINGSGGKIYLEPLTIEGSGNFRIVNASEIMIFGGDGAQIKLNNLAANAISATGDIILAVGQGGIVDLRGNNAKIFNSTNGKVKIYADTVLLDTGVTLADLANITVEKYPAQILFAVNLQGTGTIKGNANATLPLAVTVQNVGPSSDTYTLSLTNPNNWQITGLPSSLTVDGLKSQVITLQVTLPANAVGSLVNDIVIRAVSTANATATSEMKVRLIAESVQTSASCATPANYDIATSTVSIQKIDVPVLSILDGKPTGEITIFEGKLRQMPGVEDFQLLPDSLKYISSSMELNPKNASLVWNDGLFSKGGKLLTCVAVPSVVVINGMKIPSGTKNYQVTLRTLAVDSGIFHIEKITPAN